MARRDTKTAYGIIAVGFVILVAALTCMLLNKKDTLCESTNSSARASSRLGAPTPFSPVESCMVGYDYGIYSGNSCLPYMTGGSLVDY